ncbi:ABC transporter substrate-binding protein [Agrobacterium fabrum]|uniref:Peptide/nickel transport system substrate-binding protein n=1 Tax=Agrobacterium fabrum TaxID=1176649 RepID=A0A7Z7BSN3_9HYPH|nr:ABC transporter substrate-binding protein [Agrobacterium fabrum]MCR6727537.1 ABC transporter substrate-binding protein [Agrobacterium fabrum]NTB10647.1 ABC transporter substrate-binding protein [Agrobacterium fabrum]UXT60681.1 ABC transporter substrate-binding protein [Agrobacterium fabrum]WCK79609.1 ABC transporter substrate-binding protein [Agrobacterium fabrum]WIE30957.1 ABC transporter substrate-binding protein [Agrobacterium fabrum]
MRTLTRALLTCAMTVAPLGPIAAATPKDELVIAIMMTTMRGLDPHEINQLEAAEVVANLYDRLVSLPPDNITNPQPSLAESWTVSEDGKTFTFKIRRGVTFHSGNPVTARDAEWSLHRLVKLGLAPSTDLRQWGFSAKNVDQLIRATDDQTLVLETPEVWNPNLILYSLASFSTSIVDSAFLTNKEKDGDWARNYLQTADAGSGPYSLVTWRSNQLLIADSFKDYWKGEPAMKRVYLGHVPESSAQRLQIDAGDVDVATRLSSTDLSGLERDGKVTVQKVPGFGFYYLALNQKDEILSNPKVREAFRYLIDYDGLAGSVMKYYGIKQQTIIPGGLPGASLDMPYKLDIEKARQLLAEAGYPNGFSKVYFAQPGTPESEVGVSLQNNAAKAGIKLDLQIGDQIGKFRSRQFELFSSRTGERLPDPHAVLQSYATNANNADDAKLSGLVAWRSAWDVPKEIQNMVTAAAHQTDQEKRDELYARINEAYLRSSPALVTSFQRTDPKAVRNEVKGYVGHPTWLTRWDTVTKGE